MHFHQWGEVAGVTEVIGVLALGQRGAVSRFYRNDPYVLLAAQFGTDEGEAQAGKVAATAGTADHDVRVVVGQFHLAHGFLSNHRLV